MFSHDLQGFRVDFFPLLPAEHDMDVEELLGVGSVLVADRVDPLEQLSALAPVLLPAVVFLFVPQAVILLPYGG